MNKRAVIIYGPPGAGKGTQAELLERKFDFIHLDTGRYIESLVRAPGWQKNAALRRERKNFDAGLLCTPTWVFAMVKRAITRIAKAEYNAVLSGSPRTVPEAFGNTGKNGLIETLIKYYGKKNLTVVHLNISSETTKKRNSTRFICSVCGLPVLGKARVKACAFCDGKLRKRTLDDPTIIITRLNEYKERTEPILKELKKRKHKVIHINGELVPYRVHATIVKALRLAS